MSYFMQHGDAFIPTAGKESILNDLPTGTYVVAKPPMGPMYFQRVNNFTVPEKLYGDIDKKATRILSTFLERPAATGALLEGEKGSGKSQLARLISVKGYDVGIPTILVNAAFHGDEFSSLLATIEQPCIVLMDEFEKVYAEKEHQEAILTLLDGTMTTKKLFLLTVNETHNINTHMKNRPGRLFYRLSFTGLDSDFVRDYCVDNLNNQDHVEDVVKVGMLFRAFNFDMLKAIVEEMNRYDEDAFTAMEWLNAKPINEDSYGTKYRVTILDENQKDRTYNQEAEFNEVPIHARGGVMGVYYMEQEEDDDGKKTDDFFPEHLVVQSSHLRKMDAEKGVYEFYVPKEKMTVIFKKQEAAVYSYRELAY